VSGFCLVPKSFDPTPTRKHGKLPTSFLRNKAQKAHCFRIPLRKKQLAEQQRSVSRMAAVPEEPDSLCGHFQSGAAESRL